MREYKYQDERTKAEVTIHGDLIARATSDTRPGSYRSTMIEVFKTEAGKFAVVTTGTSLIFHSGRKPCLTKSNNPRGKETPYSELSMEAVPCPNCKPEEFAPPEEIAYMEQNRSRVVVVKSASEVYKALCGYDPITDTHFLSNVGNKAWVQVQAVEPDARQHTIEVR